MKINSKSLAAIVLAVIFGGVAITSLLGFWKTTSTKIPATYKDGEFKGTYNPADIRGSYTLDDIKSAFEIPLEDLGKAFGVKDPSRYASFQCKELETLYASLKEEGTEIGTGSVRFFVALYKGLPYNAEEETYLPKQAVDILKAKAKLTDEQIKYLDSHSVTLPDTLNTTEQPTAAPKDENASDSKLIKGNTTFKEVLDWGVKKEDIEKILGEKLPDTGKTIRDYLTSKGVEFSSVKENLQNLVDNVK